MASISIKNDMLLQYIQALPEGSKISVRELSAKLLVSEGTAYKAVKEAEHLGLVMVKPKAGTVRISVQQPPFENVASAADIAKILGLSVNAGRENLNRQIKKLIICDGSEQDMLRQLKEAEPANCLCLCGDRPELQRAILEHGANLLVTGGTRAGWVLDDLAERKKLIIFSSPQSSFALMRIFNAEYDEALDQSDGNKATSWMQTPDYMYYNDLIADWQRHYVESCIPKQYPLVDDDLEIFGALDLWKSATAVPSQKLSTALANNNELSPVTVDDSIKDITRQFVVNEQFFAPVLDGRRMMGIISAVDLLRYYMWSESEPGTNSTDSFLTLDSSSPDEKDVTFRVHIPASALNGMGHLENDLLLSAAESHLRQLGMINYKVTNGTFFTLKPLSYTENLQLESRIQSSTPESAVMELELYDEKDSYAKMVITASLNDGKDE